MSNTNDDCKPSALDDSDSEEQTTAQPPPDHNRASPMMVFLEASIDAIEVCTHCCKMDDVIKKPPPQPRAAINRTASFIRAHDLDISEEDIAKCSEEARDGGEEEQRCDILCISGRSKELLSLEGGGSGAIMSALVTIGLHEATDETARWVATGPTDKALRKRAKAAKAGAPLDEGPRGAWPNAASGTNDLVWSSKCHRPGHGADYPVVKSRGLIPAAACDVVELIKDSERVMEYNKMSVGREDEAILHQNESSSVHCSETKCPKLGVAGEAKLMSSKSQPPLTRKPLEFKTLFYARQLEASDGVPTEGAAYITVGRSVWETPEGTDEGSDGTTTRCEILLSVNLVREVANAASGEAWCELTMITHAVSPGVPVFVGKQLGLLAAENYIRDIRALFEKK